MPSRRALALFAALLASACGADAPTTRVVLLGFDGLPTHRLLAGIRSGALPHFAALAATSGLRTLTDVPGGDASRAWTTVATGRAADAHGIHAAQVRAVGTYATVSGVGRVEPGHAWFGWSRVAPTLASRRAVPTIWEQVAARGLVSVALGVPGSFPVRHAPRSRVLAGWPTPDVAGTDGRYQYFSSARDERALDYGRLVPLTFSGREARATLEGPVAPLVETTRSLPLSVRWVPDDRSVVVSVDRQVLYLTEGRWSRWLRLAFTTPRGPTYHGRVRFHLIEAGNAVRLYATPVHLDPADALLPVAAPREFGPWIADRIDSARTLGWPEATAAALDGILDPLVVLEEATEAVDDRAAALLQQLDTQDWSLLTAVVDTPGHLRPLLPLLRDERTAARAREAWLVEADALLGEIRRALPPGTSLLVVSLDRDPLSAPSGLLAAFLTTSGWMTRATGAAVQRAGALPRAWPTTDALGDIEWTTSKAFAVAPNLVYINLRGREPSGIVPLDAYAGTVDALAAALRRWTPDAPVSVRAVHATADARGPSALGDGPDLVVDFSAPVDGRPPDVTPSVPVGVLLGSPAADDPLALRDIAGLVLAHLGLATPQASPAGAQ